MHVIPLCTFRSHERFSDAILEFRMDLSRDVWLFESEDLASTGHIRPVLEMGKPISIASAYS